MFIECFNSASINILTKFIQQDFGFDSEANVQLIETVYNVAYISFILLGAYIGDRYGNRFIWVSGMLLLCIATLTIPLTLNKDILIFSRILQGISYALIHPTSLSMIHLQEVSPERNGNLNKHIGFYYICGLCGSVFGLILSGIFAEYIKWTWIFYIQSIVIAFLSITGEFYLPPTPQNYTTDKFNMVENLLIISILSTFSYYFNASYNYGWTSDYALRILLITYASVLSYILYDKINQKKKWRVPLIPFNIFYKELKYFIFMFVNGGTYNSVNFLFPLYFLNVYNLSFINMVILIVAQIIINIIFVSLTTRVLNDSNQYHLMNISGLLFGFGLLMLSYSSQLAMSILCCIIVNCAIGMNIGSTTIIINKIASRRAKDIIGGNQIGIINSLSTIVFTTGMIIGLSLTTSAFANSEIKSQTDYTSGYLFNGLLFVVGSIITTYLTMRVTKGQSVIPLQFDARIRIQVKPSTELVVTTGVINPDVPTMEVEDILDEVTDY